MRFQLLKFLSDWTTLVRTSMSIKRADFFKLNLDPLPINNLLVKVNHHCCSMIQHPASSQNQKPRCSSSTYPKPSFWLWQQIYEIHLCSKPRLHGEIRKALLLNFIWTWYYDDFTVLCRKADEENTASDFDILGCHLFALSSVLPLFPRCVRDPQSAGFQHLNTLWLKSHHDHIIQTSQDTNNWHLQQWGLEACELYVVVGTLANRNEETVVEWLPSAKPFVSVLRSSNESSFRNNARTWDGNGSATTAWQPETFIRGMERPNPQPSEMCFN